MARPNGTPVVAMLALDSGFDTNGNARRLFVAIGSGNAIEGAWGSREEVPPELQALAATALRFKGRAKDRREALAAHVRNGRAHGAAQSPPLKYRDLHDSAILLSLLVENISGTDERGPDDKLQTTRNPYCNKLFRVAARAVGALDD